MTDLAGLTDRERGMLELERLWWRHEGNKEREIRTKFGMSLTGYYQALNALVDRQEALAFDPVVVNRLRRLRSTRQRTRSARRLGLQL